MSEIPADLIGKANDIWIEALEEGSPDSALIIAKAILAERDAQRERDAKIVLDWQSHIRRGELIEFHAMNVADAIRKSEA